MGRFGTLIALAALGWALAAVAGPSPREILDRADRARGNLPGLVWTVTLTAAGDGEERTQTIEVKARGDDVLATFLAPPRIKGQKVLMAGRNMWFLKPGLSRPVPISPRQKLMGEAANGDLASTNYAGDYDGAIQGEEAVDGEPCYVFDLTARTKTVTYDRIVYWVSKPRLVGVKADFYTVSGKRFKSAEFRYGHDIVTGGETIPFVSRMVIRDALRPEAVTTLEYADIEVKSLPDATFNLNLLMR